ncbi:MAG: hypothetical protein VYE22_06825 [Myxococcota bacterium]|nr:hypothetical protein [Myxococcota bacterium]
MEILYEDETNRHAVQGNVHFVVWWDAPTVEQMIEYGRCADSVALRNPGGSGLMNLVVDGMPRFSGEVREAAKTHTTKGLHTVGAAHVILVGGLLGSAVRGFLGTTVLLGRPKNPTKVFGDLDSAARWMSGRLLDAGRVRWTEETLLEAARRAVTR